MEVFTIGFARKSAGEFFGVLRRAGIQRVVDVRLNNVSQLAGFTKRDDLAFFLRELCGADYLHEPLLAPTQEILDRYRKHGGGAERWEREFRELVAERRIEERIDPAVFAPRTVLLCSEPSADRCHRRLVGEHLARHWGDLTLTHL